MEKIKPRSKKQALRNNEYYQMQNKFDILYKYSKENRNFYKLYEQIIDEDNIKLAYRNIKNNKGAKTKGTDHLNINHLNNINIVKMVRDRLSDYKPKSVRRVMIPKTNSKLRPLGIPSIEDRLIQQCILQILEPICEAKFYNHSYGFRPNRNTHHAIARFYSLANINKLHYVVDVDIKGFFDNVDHSKLIKQIYTMGIRDKKVISIIKKILKAEIEGEGIPTKGTPQGGILSPLLSNIVLNELDWWISSQWEFIETKHKYGHYKKNGVFDQTAKYTALRKTKLKEMYIVRYADDFKIMCRDYNTAYRINIAVRNWLKERLNLEVSDEKSKITNLRKDYSEYLGFKIKVTYKHDKKKWTTKSHLSDTSMNKVYNTIKECIKDMVDNQDINVVSRYNATILGMQNYYSVATHVNKDFAKINYKCSIVLHNRLRKNLKVIKNMDEVSQTYKNLYGSYTGRTHSMKGVTLFLIYGVKHKNPMNFSQDICSYTEAGRIKIHENLNASYDLKMLDYLLKNPNLNESSEFNDNRISLYIGQRGRCSISGESISAYDDIHHIKGRKIIEPDKYKNLAFVKKNIHYLIHATQNETINKLLKEVNLNEQQLRKLNNYRKKYGNYEIAK